MFINEVEKLNLYTTNKEKYKYSICYSESGEGAWSIEYFFDSLYNFNSCYYSWGTAEKDDVQYSVFKNGSLIYLVDSVYDGDIYLRIFARSLEKYKGLEKKIKYKYEKEGRKMMDIKYKFLTSGEFYKKGNGITKQLRWYVNRIKNDQKDFHYEKYSEGKIDGKYFWRDSAYMTPFETDIYELSVDSLLFIKILNNELRY